MSVLLPSLRPPLKRSSALTDAVTRAAVSGLEDWAHELTQRLARLDALDVVQSAGAVTSVTGTGFVTATPTSGDVVVSVDLSSKLDAANVSGTLNTVAKFTAADAIGDSSITDDGSLVLVDSKLTVNGRSGTPETILGLYSSTGETVTRIAGVSGKWEGSVDTSAAHVDGYHGYGGFFAALGTRSAGSEPLRNCGIRVSAANAQENYAIWTDQGNHLYELCNVFITADGLGDAVAVFSDRTAVTANSAMVAVTNASTVNTTSSALNAYAYYGDANASRSAGANSLTCIGARLRARGGQVNQALRTEEGDVLLNNVSGTTTVKGATNFSSTVVVSTLGVTAATKAVGSWAAEVTRNSADSRLAVSAYGTSVSPVLVLYRGRGTAAATTAVQSGDLLGEIDFSGNPSSGNALYAGGYIRGIATQTWTSSVGGSKLDFSTTPNGSGSAGRAVRMTIDHDGDVIVGASASMTKAFNNGLEVTRDASADIVVSSYGTSVAPTFRLFRGRGTAAATTAIASGDQIGLLVFTGSVGGSGQFAGTYIQGVATQSWSASDTGSKLEFITTPNSNNAGRATRMTIDQDGTVTVANNSVVNGSLTANANASLTGTLDLNATAGSNGQIAQVSGGVPVWGAPSAASIPTGTGVANRIPKWTGTNTLANGSIDDDGVAIGNRLNEFHFLNSTNAEGTGYINYYGFGTGVTQTRHLIIANGKSSTIASFNGTSLATALAGGLTVAGALTVAGNVTLGDATTDAHTVNGQLTITDGTQPLLLGGDWGGVSGDNYLATNGDIVVGIGGVEYMRYESGFGVRVPVPAAFGGNCTLGDAAGDSHTVNGALDCNQTLNVDGATTVAALTASGDVRLQGAVTSLESAAVIVCNDTTDTLAFHGAAGVAQQTVTGSRSANAALASLLTALANLGLIVDSTT